MCVALVIQHAKRMRRITLLSVVCPSLPYFSALSHDFREKVIEHVFFPQVLSKKFLTLRRIRWDIILSVHRLLCRVPVILVRFTKTWNVPTDFWRKKPPQIPNFTKICAVEVELFRADGRTNITKLRVAFRNFANAPKSSEISPPPVNLFPVIFATCLTD